MWIIYLFSLYSQWVFADVPPAGFILNPEIQQCEAALPTIGWAGFDHTWLESQNQSFGMPYSLTHDAIRGGFATIRSPDPSLPNLTSEPVCQPIFQPEQIPAHIFTEKFLCLISKLTDSDEVVMPDWQPIFVYDWALTNCHSSVRFIMDCAGGEMSLNPNGGLGSHYSSNQVLNVLKKNLKAPSEPEVFQLQINFQKFTQSLRKVFQEHGDTASFLKDNVPLILSQSQALSKSLSPARDLRRTTLYRRLQKFDFNFSKLTTQMQATPQLGLLQKIEDLSILFKQPDLTQKTFQQICEQAQKECL